MSEVLAGAGRAGERISGAAACTAAGLRYAAAPVFAAMAVMTGARGGAEDICSAAPSSSPLAGMTAMYALMAVIHAPPWLSVLRRQRDAQDQATADPR